jgi:hypothetical protein
MYQVFKDFAGPVATVAAVAVSLYLARRSETVRLRVLLGISLTNKAPSAQYVTLQIDNIGARVASLSPQFFAKGGSSEFRCFF